MLTHLTGHTASDRKWNEDTYAMADSYLFVLDGATGLGENDIMGTGDDAKWFVEQIKERLVRELPGALSIQDILERAIVELRQQYEKRNPQVQKADIPSAGIALFRQRQDQLEFFGMGDCRGIVELTDGSYECLYDKRLEALDHQVIEQMKKLSMERKLPFLQTRAMVQKELRINREKRNTEDGYCALDLNSICVKQATVRVWKCNNVKRILSMSDGMAEVFAFNLYANEGELMDAVRQDVTGTILALFAAQDRDAACDEVPRLKKRDDTTVAYAEIGE